MILFIHTSLFTPISLYNSHTNTFYSRFIWHTRIHAKQTEKTCLLSIDLTDILRHIISFSFPPFSFPFPFHKSSFQCIYVYVWYTLFCPSCPPRACVCTTQWGPSAAALPCTCAHAVLWWCDGVMWWYDVVMIWCGDDMMWWCDDDMMMIWCGDVVIMWCGDVMWWYYMVIRWYDNVMIWMMMRWYKMMRLDNETIRENIRNKMNEVWWDKR